MAKTAVIGAGSWGTALAILLQENGHQVTLWGVHSENVNRLKKDRELKKKLPGVKIPEAIKITSDLEEAATDQEILVLAVPSVHTRETAAKLKGLIKDGQLIVDVSKGI